MLSGVSGVSVLSAVSVLSGASVLSGVSVLSGARFGQTASRDGRDAYVAALFFMYRPSASRHGGNTLSPAVSRAAF